MPIFQDILFQREFVRVIAAFSTDNINTQEEVTHLYLMVYLPNEYKRI